MMARLLLLTTLCCFLLLSNAQYRRVTSLTDNTNYTSIVYLPSLSHLFFYTSTTKQIKDLRAYDYTQLSYSNLKVAPTYVIAYSVYNSTDEGVLYSSSSGEVWAKIMTKMGWVQEIVMERQEQIVFSYVQMAPMDGYLMAYAEGGQRVYYMNMDDGEVMNVDYSQRGGSVTRAKWLPTSETILISGGNSTQQRYFELFYPLTQNTQDLLFLTVDIVLDFTFRGDALYFIQIDNEAELVGQQLISMYDLQTKARKFIKVPTTSQLRRINIKGNFMEVIDETSIIRIYNLVDDAWYGAYPTLLHGYGLSPDGSDFIARDTLYPTQINIYKLCINKTQYFNSQTNLCSPCDLSCTRCFFESTHCPICIPTHYFAPSSYTCRLCDDAIQGCSQCSNATFCSICDASKRNYFPLPYNNGTKCQCRGGYFQWNRACYACGQGCFTCKNASSCLQCQAPWKLVNTKCQCPTGYIIDNHQCLRCSSFISFCIECDSTTNCLQCSQGFELKDNHGKCQEIEDGVNGVVIAVAVVVPVVVIGVGVWLYLKKKRARRAEPLLDQEEGSSNLQSDYA